MKNHKTDCKCSVCKVIRGETKGSNHPNYIDGRTLKKYYCVDCNKKISYQTSCYGKGRCSRCAQKYNLYLNGHPNKGKIWKYSGWRGKGGYYNKIWMRSSYELSYAKYLDKHQIVWEYEPKAFDLGNITYRPDFYLPEIDEYIEIKGWFTEPAKRKIQLFRDSYPDIKLKLLRKKDLINMGVI